MQAIYTKYLPASNTRGSRIKATCDRGSITIAYPSQFNDDERHIYAAECLVAKFVKEDVNKYGSDVKGNPWRLPRVCGGMPDSIGGMVHVYITKHGRKYSPSLRAVINKLY